jgi:putative DNA methylase
MTDDRRLIEDYLPIEAISAEGGREKNVRRGHISTLHLWWARRPLVACRAAVYGCLVPAAQFVPNGGTDAQKKSLARANAAKFVKSLCQHPFISQSVQEARRQILSAHASRLTIELGKSVTPEDIQAGHAPRPRVLDMFAGGGAIPLESMRLGCEAYANDLNPVAHIIQLCTLVYPQTLGKPDKEAIGMTGPSNSEGKTTWGYLADEIHYWASWVSAKTKSEIGTLYPPIPDPEFKGTRGQFDPKLWKEDADDIPKGYLLPVAYLWTRTVACKNPACKACVPLLRQTWLCKMENRYVALRVLAPRNAKQVRFEVVESHSEGALGFDPEAFSSAGNATCPFCGTVADSEYVKAEGCAGRMGLQPMAAIAVKDGSKGKCYLPPEASPASFPSEQDLQRRIEELCGRTGLTIPNEKITTDAKNSCWTHLYGLTRFADLFTRRQLLSLLTLCSMVREAEREMEKLGISGTHRKALATYLACVLDKQADFNSSLCVLKAGGGRGIVHTFGRQALPMTWDFAEANPFNPEISSWDSSLNEVEINARDLSFAGTSHVVRGSAASLPWPDQTFDAVVTDPPYYDNVPYANISDFFFVWLKRSIGHLYPEHFAGETTPKRSEAVADATRHGGDKDAARRAYEAMMMRSFKEAHRTLKQNGHLCVVYAHKTTLGWTTLVGALKQAGFMVTEAWPLDTETSGRLRAQSSAALATSIFLVARKREGAMTGAYEQQVRPGLEDIVRERVETLWEMGISGADLVIACVGGGLRAFTRFARVEYANGEEVPADRFLTEVETVVLESILARLSKEVGGKGTSLAGLDPATRFYILWRYTYSTAELEAGEAIIFANGTHVELDGLHSLTSGTHALVSKRKSKYALSDFSERGEDEHLGLPSAAGQPAPLVDVLHRALWLMEKRPAELPAFLRNSQVNREQLRLVAQALAGPALKGGELGDVSPTAELSALGKLTANWQTVVEDAALTTGEKEERKKGQKQLI